MLRSSIDSSVTKAGVPDVAEQTLHFHSVNGDRRASTPRGERPPAVVAAHAGLQAVARRISGLQGAAGPSRTKANIRACNGHLALGKTKMLHDFPLLTSLKPCFLVVTPESAREYSLQQVLLWRHGFL